MMATRPGLKLGSSMKICSGGTSVFFYPFSLLRHQLCGLSPHTSTKQAQKTFIHVARDQPTWRRQLLAFEVGSNLVVFLRNMAEINNAKRRRNSTGGTSDVLEAADLTYAQVAHIDLGKMSVNDKLDFLIHEMSTVKQLTQQVQQQQSQLSQLNDITENMQTEIVHMHHILSQQVL